jgi:hypothetical protein
MSPETTSEILFAAAEDPDCPTHLASLLADCAKDVAHMEHQTQSLAVALTGAATIGNPDYAYIGPNLRGA